MENVHSFLPKGRFKNFINPWSKQEIHVYISIFCNIFFFTHIFTWNVQMYTLIQIYFENI